jgi:hypothetical protein
MIYSCIRPPSEHSCFEMWGGRTAAGNSEMTCDMGGDVVSLTTGCRDRTRGGEEGTTGSPGGRRGAWFCWI